MVKTFEIQEIDELEQVASYILELTKSHVHFCFDAEMGAGKTTLINLICKKLGVEEQTSSPTYSIVNEYLTKENKKIFHFDLYRIKDELELLEIGIIEILDSNSICFIEWPEKTLNFLPHNYVKIEIEKNNSSRILNIYT